MFDFSNYDLTLNVGPSSAPPNPQPSTSNQFPFANYFAQPLAFYNQFSQQLNAQNYASIPSPATINNLANSFQQQQFSSPTGFTTPNLPSIPQQQQHPQYFFQQHQPSTSFQSVYSTTNDALNSLQQQTWSQSQWPVIPSQATTSNLLYSTTNAYALNRGQSQIAINVPTTPPELPLPSLFPPPLSIPSSSSIINEPSNDLWIPKKALERTIVLLQKQNNYMSSWTEKTCQLYFKKWFETTVHIPVKDVETSKIIIRPDYIIGFFSFDLDAATYLVNLFANGNLRNEVLIMSASDFLLHMMRLYKDQNSLTCQISNIDDAFSTLFSIKKQKQEPSSAPPYQSYMTNPFG